ncbi:hypothetical protein F2P81_021908 [Scophthalmus maximus]|uniref:ribonuclease H n=1 Tax=Scophthalmus maximus TaxID=52904 RepID=A0A6A4RX49_SCOMX|nr:hypothetical protein F2P81_021908 [Scophthalmus maximus]
MEEMLSSLTDECCIPYLDDILCYSGSFEDHVKVVRKVLRALQHQGVKLPPDKCEMFKAEVRYVGGLTLTCRLSSILMHQSKALVPFSTSSSVGKSVNDGDMTCHFCSVSRLRLCQDALSEFTAEIAGPGNVKMILLHFAFIGLITVSVTDDMTVICTKEAAIEALKASDIQTKHYVLFSDLYLLAYNIYIYFVTTTVIADLPSMAVTANQQDDLVPALTTALTAALGTLQKPSPDSAPRGSRIKLGRYDGLTSWETDCGQFDLLATANDWSPSERAVQLVSALEGEARRVLLDVTAADLGNPQAISKALKRRFGSTTPAVVMRQRFNERVREPGEKPLRSA